MKTIEYSPSGEAIGDNQAERRAREFLKGSDSYIKVDSAVFIMMIRALIYERLFPHTEVQFLFEGGTLLPDVNGRLQEWPGGFCDVYDEALERLLSNPPRSGPSL